MEQIMMQELPYKTVSQTQQYGKYTIGVQINVHVGHELSDAEMSVINNACDSIVNVLYHGSVAADPETMERIRKENENLLALFPGCGHKKIPNEYSSDPNRPWLNVFTPKGTIKIGWRKRVINIDWSETIVVQGGNELFPDEDVTNSNLLPINIVP
jgi:hypothetical protein